jgi:hypothetical protein
MEFDRGWLVDRNAAKDHRGGLTFVRDRDVGRVVSFPPFLPPGSIMADYDEALPDGLPESL